MDVSSFLEIIDHENALLVLSALSLLLIILLLHKLHQAAVLRDEFVHIISHKFRTPLSSAKWTIENLLSVIQDPLQKKDIVDVQKMNNHLIHITNTMLELADTNKASVKSYNFERVNVAELISHVTQNLKDSFRERNIILSVMCDSQLFVKADQTRLKFVLYSILQNSINYTKIGGMVEVRAERKRRKVLITIADNGIGMEPKDVRRLFSKFHRAENATKMDTEGLGVGLYLAKGIIHRLNGKIKGGSNGKDKGSMFIITLPAIA